MTSKRLIVIIAVAGLVFMPAVTAFDGNQSQNTCKGAKENKVVDKDEDFSFHIEYNIQFSEDNKMACIVVENKGELEFPATFTLSVDGDGFSPKMPDLEGGESKSVTLNTTKYIDATRDNHSVNIGAGGKESAFNFTKKVNSTSPSSSTPYVGDIQINRSGTPTELIATVHNPGKRAYALHVRAETFETEGAFDIGAPQPGNTSEFQIPLDEGPNEVVAGKVMVFNDTGSPDGKFDQKEFMAKPNETASAWDDHFEQVPGERADVSYDNETARQYREGYVDDEALSPLERRAGAVLVVFALVGAVLWRRSR
ncbi:hypothetical protein ABSL23_13625 [Halobacterium sp. NMX12-1]|uniref:PGF-CTERM sorting domain-containing protein n=1 Tax=Halobacterium sp. NMX12-1 TaxID=3166650 RepID=A0AAU8CAZ9_9EURY